MRIFVSYAFEDSVLAEKLATSLSNDGHQVFWDKRNVNAGEPFDSRIRQAIWRSYLFIFLASPEALEQGSYARAELTIAAKKWASPANHVLPILTRGSMEQLPAFLRVSLLESAGDVVAEAAFAVSLIARKRLKNRVATAALGLSVLLAIVAVAIYLPVLLKPDPFDAVRSEKARQASESLWKTEAQRLGFKGIEILETWDLNFMDHHSFHRNQLLDVLRRKAAAGEKGNLLLALWHPTLPDHQGLSWAASGRLGSLEQKKL